MDKALSANKECKLLQLLIHDRLTVILAEGTAFNFIDTDLFNNLADQKYVLIC